MSNEPNAAGGSSPALSNEAFCLRVIQLRERVIEKSGATARRLEDFYLWLLEKGEPVSTMDVEHLCQAPNIGPMTAAVIQAIAAGASDDDVLALVPQAEYWRGSGDGFGAKHNLSLEFKRRMNTRYPT